MEQLDRVYETFKNLDNDYAKAKMSKSDFIKSKFGGDINVGSTIILDFLSSQQFEQQDDIEKISFIREIFDKIKLAQDSLDKLPNFKFEMGANASILLDSIRRSLENSGNIIMRKQRELYDKHKVVHFLATTTGAEYTPLNTANVLSVFNTNMLAEVSNATGDSENYNVGDIAVLAKNGKYSKKTLRASLKYMN